MNQKIIQIIQIIQKLTKKCPKIGQKLTENEQ